MRGLKSVFGIQESNRCVLIVMVAAGVLAGCSTPRPSTLDPEIHLLAESASAAYQRGEVDRAGGLYHKALQRARLIDAQDEVARNAYNLALCRLAGGNLTEARSLLQQAGALSRDSGLETARIRLAEAEVARSSGDPAGCQKRAREALAAGVDHEGRVQALLLQGEAACGSGRLPSAVEFYQAARSLVTDRTPALLGVRLDDLAIRLTEAKALVADEAALHASRANGLKKAGQYTMMAAALASAAERYEQDSKWSDAFSCRIRAAQSLLAEGNRERATAMVRKAGELAERIGNAKYKALVAGLAADLK